MSLFCLLPGEGGMEGLTNLGSFPPSSFLSFLDMDGLRRFPHRDVI